MLSGHSGSICFSAAAIQAITRRYVTVNEEAERALFYAFAESQSSASRDPLMLWLNGYVMSTLQSAA